MYVPWAPCHDLTVFVKTIYKKLTTTLNIPFGLIDRWKQLETIKIGKRPDPAISTHMYSFWFQVSTLIILLIASPFASHSLISLHIPFNGHQPHLYVWLFRVTEEVHSAYRFGWPCHGIRNLQELLATNNSWELNCQSLSILPPQVGLWALYLRRSGVSP